MSEYITLTQNEQDDQIVSYYASQERDKNNHETNIARFQTLLPTLAEGDFKDHINKLLVDSQNRLEQVLALINATQSQLPPTDRIQASLIRLRSKGILPGD